MGLFKIRSKYKILSIQALLDIFIDVAAALFISMIEEIMDKFLRASPDFVFRFVDRNDIPKEIEYFSDSISTDKEDLFFLREVKEQSISYSDKYYYVDKDYGSFAESFDLCPYAILLRDIGVIILWPKNETPHSIRFYLSGYTFVYMPIAKKYAGAYIFNDTDTEREKYAGVYIFNNADMRCIDNNKKVFLDSQFRNITFEQLFGQLLPRQKDFLMKNLNLFCVGN